MDTIQRTKSILGEAEKALAALASEAAKGTQYEAASCLIDSARELNRLTARTLLSLGHSAPDEVSTGLSHEAAEPGKANVATVRTPGRDKPKKTTYPKFLRQSDDLVKVAWSPTDKAEYEHKCPKKVLSLLATAIAKAGANGKRFAMDRVIPLQDHADGRRIPDYQVYLCLAWFKELGFVIQHGRQGYSLASNAPIEPILEVQWASLPTR